MSKQNDATHSDAILHPYRTDQALKTIKSEELFHGTRELHIDHKGALYKLKITRQDKLILNK